jgi:protein-S-isoprenylcysteine O-methyltransferase Ste14
MSKVMSMIYGVVAYAAFLASAVYAIGFIGGFGVPKTIDSGVPGDVTSALMVNAMLLGLFAVQHTGMARQAFKSWITRFIPASIERSTYVLTSSLTLILMYVAWRPMPQVIWHVEGAMARGVIWMMFASGWLIFLAASFMIHHFDLFGLRQVWLSMQDKPYTDLGFRTPGFYRFVRHPIQAGFLIAFWSTPTMTLGHLVFSMATTAYIFIAVLLFEERDLARNLGETYRSYQRQVYGFLPLRRFEQPRLSGARSDDTAPGMRAAA